MPAMPTLCASCGAPHPLGSKFCPVCGIAQPASTRPLVDRFGPPSSYTPPHLAERILTHRSALEGEHKMVTVMFCDIVDSTSLAERLGPEGMYQLLTRFFELALEEIHRYEGTVNQFLGDGFMAIFGAPLALEQHERQAALAALRLCHRARVDLPSINIRIGMNTGLVVVGKIGDNLRMDYTAVGSTTHVAARLEGLAGPGQIVVSDSTYDGIQGIVEVDGLPPQTLKGVSAPLRPYRVLRARSSRSTFRGLHALPLSPMVGRGRELDELGDAVNRVEEGQGQLVGIVGEPGIGKSRLVLELQESLAGRHLTLLQGQCHSYGMSIAYLPILEVVRANCQIAETDTPEVAIEKVRAAVIGVGMEVASSLPYLLHILGLKDTVEPISVLSPETVKARTFETLRQLCLRGSRLRPIVFVVEDVHWIDRSSEEFLELLAESIAGAAILVVTTYRPGYGPGWMRKSYATQIALRPLTQRDSVALVRSRTHAGDLPHRVLDEILSRGEGNPLFLEELTRVIGDETEAGNARPIPETLQGVLTARIDRLPEEMKQFLQVASVVGREFSVRLLGAVWNRPESVGLMLRHLTQLEFLIERPGYDDPQFAFRHALTGDAVYGGMLEGRRRSLHGVVGRALEVLHASRPDEALELLAYHFGRSGEDNLAVDYAISAAEKAQRRWANNEALALAEAALGRLTLMPDLPENRLRRIDAVLKQAEVRFVLGQHSEQIEALEAIRTIVQNSGDAARRAAWHYWMGFLRTLTGERMEETIRHCREAADIAEAAGLEEIRAQADTCLAQVYVFSGAFGEALESGERALAIFEAHGNLSWACRALAQLSPAANARREWDRSLEYCRRTAIHAATMADRRLKVSALVRTASTHVQRGDWQAGIRFCHEAMALGPSPFDAAAIKAINGYGLIKGDQVEPGIALLEEAVSWYRRSHLRFTICQFSLWLAEGYGRGGRVPPARELLEEVVAEAEGAGYRHLEAVGRNALAELRSKT
jgi:class 3 adenylate cyclase/tetratricopeptide (TPR) repeat protein